MIPSHATLRAYPRNSAEAAARIVALALIANGRMCLGRPFEDDVQGRYTVQFELVKK